MSSQAIFATSTITTDTSLPPFVSIISTITHSPTFDQVINQPINSLFSSQSTNPEKVNHDEEPNDDDVMVSFANIHFDQEKENIPDDLINLKFNSRSSI